MNSINSRNGISRSICSKTCTIYIHLYPIGSYAYTVSFDSISQAPSSFNVEAQYATNSGYRTVSTMGPGSYTIRGNNGAGQDRIRFKSHSIVPFK
ncbi:colicin Z C-terminal domain-related protein [Xenorhabdus littoralis]|uniref:colicin Z C-terminal domain-related protein n=1 Tax=Xenorhabdus littoralis TaxID=2582835 RepID=UPI0029E7EBD9|nr:colicin Z C-terminal domain-related protein [Xenorhabdus sp. Reich]